MDNEPPSSPRTLGLPLLYAAFNTFEPVHDAILRGLSIASGGTAGSPLDVTDSLVIPFGLGIALWVWQRGVASSESLRVRWGPVNCWSGGVGFCSHERARTGLWHPRRGDFGRRSGSRWARGSWPVSKQQRRAELGRWVR